MQLQDHKDDLAEAGATVAVVSFGSEVNNWRPWHFEKVLLQLYNLSSCAFNF